MTDIIDGKQIELTHCDFGSGLDFTRGVFVAQIDGVSTIVGDMPDPQNGWYAGIDTLKICEKYIELGRPLTADECSAIIDSI